MGYVPAMEAGAVTLTEGPAVLTYIADLAAEGVLAPPPLYRRALRAGQVAQLRLDRNPQGRVRAADDAGLDRGRARLGAEPGRQAVRRAVGASGGARILLDEFTVADAYLLAVLNWCEYAGIEHRRLAGAAAWRGAMRTRPSVARAMATEMPLLQAA